MKAPWAWIARSLVLALAAALSSCITARPQASNRHGLFDQFSAGESRHSRAAVSRDPAEAAEEALKKPMPIQLHWPLKHVRVTSPFGQRGAAFHEGVDLRARTGTPVYAAHSGIVLYASDRIRGYGKMIVLKSSSGISTVYAHNSRLLVHKGQWIRQGRLIARSGHTGHVTAPHLHFEVRRGIVAVDPVKVLPGAKYASYLPPPLIRPSRYARRVALRQRLRQRQRRPAAVAVSDDDESPSGAE